MEEKGEWPATLEVKDPLTGESLVYRQDGDGIRLYSVGLNGVDDGGVEDFDGGEKDDVGIHIRN